eukprot:1147211-Pelagomonas_calceolata.AAC.9
MEVTQNETSVWTSVFPPPGPMPPCQVGFPEGSAPRRVTVPDTNNTTSVRPMDQLHVVKRVIWHIYRLLSTGCTPNM